MARTSRLFFCERIIHAEEYLSLSGAAVIVVVVVVVTCVLAYIYTSVIGS